MSVSSFPGVAQHPSLAVPVLSLPGADRESCDYLLCWMQID